MSEFPDFPPPPPAITPEDVWTYVGVYGRLLTSLATPDDIVKFLGKGAGTEVPDDKSLYDLIALDRLDHETYGLNALRTAILARLLKTDFDAKILDKVPYTTKEIKLYPDGENYSAWAESGTMYDTHYFVWGSWVEVVPADTITEDFIILGVATCTADTAIAGEFHVQIGVGGAGEEVPKACVHGHIMQDGAGRALFGETIPLLIPVKIDANSRVAARSSFEDYDAVSRAFGVKVMYIELPL